MKLSMKTSPLATLAVCSVMFACSSSSEGDLAAAPETPAASPPDRDGAVAPADAGSEQNTPDAAPEPPMKRVFVSSTTLRGGGIGGAAGADKECQLLADAAKLGGTFRAQLAYTNATPPITVGPYVLVDGTVVLEEGKRLSNGVVHPINMTEKGGTAVDGSRVWTGATNQTCDNWNTTNEYMVGTYGIATSIPQFAAADLAECVGAFASIYCFEH